MKNKKIFVFFLIFVLTTVIFFMLQIDDNKYSDSITYKGKTYVLLKYNTDVFNYNFKSNDYYKEDIIHDVSHNKWDIIYFNGDLFILDKQIKEATKYYADDNNYKWFIIFYKDSLEEKVPTSLNEEELKYLYNMENIKKIKTMTFGDIKQSADIVKESKDGLVQSLINLVHYEDSWYWKTKIMTDNEEEYIINLPVSLNDKIFDLLKSNEMKN